MKLKIFLLIISLFTVSTSLFAKPVVDSVGVKNDDGKKVVLFKVKAKDTYYSIGRRYHVSTDAIMKYNGSKKQTLSIGKIVMVPTDEPYKKSRKEKANEEATETKKEKKERLAKEKKGKHKEDATEDEAPAEETQAPERVVQQPVQQQQPQPVQQIQQAAPQTSSPAVQYKVSAGETLYGIAKRFGSSVDEITKLNNLTSTNLAPGQMLTVKAAVVAATPPPVQVQAAAPVATQPVHQEMPVTKRDSPTVLIPANDSANSEHHLNSNRYGLFEKNEKGAATWIDDTSLDPNKKLVLHRTAPVGTVIKITNPMTNRTTFAKVVGRFTDSEATKDVIIVMTKNVADSLGALDKRFYVTISYGSPNE